MAERTYHFERLTPIDNMDLNVYEEAIDYAFVNSDIKNVAISGAYSAGKSSVLDSYKKKHSNMHFLHISLAHFKSPDQEDETEVKESVLEGKILNQLIHQIPSEKIPQTNFRVKKKVNEKNITKLTIGIVLFFILTLYFIYFDIWKSYVNTLPNNWFKSLLGLSTHQYALIVGGLLMVALFSFAVYGLISVQKNRNIFRKLNLKGNEIEIFEESKDSYFDKYLNEVLYLFENADADVIVFEDMDRFNANKIFERLREVNMLVNIHLQKKAIRFFAFSTCCVMTFLFPKTEQSFLTILFQSYLLLMVPTPMISLFLISKMAEYLRSLMKVFCKAYLYILMICAF